MQIKNSDFISKYHGVVTSDFWFLPNAEPWLKWPAAPDIKIQSRLKHFKLIMSHSSTLTHIALSIATFCFPCFDRIVKHFLWSHCDNTSFLSSPVGKAWSPRTAWISWQTRIQGMWWIPLCNSNSWKTRSNYVHSQPPQWPEIWIGIRPRTCKWISKSTKRQFRRRVQLNTN